MPKPCRAIVAIGAAFAVLACPAVVDDASAWGAPLPGSCTPSNVADGVCTVRLKSVSADAVDGTITGTPVGGGVAITLAGQGDAYQKSAGFGGTPPDAIQRWDTTIESENNLGVDASDPNWYGNAKSRTFLPRTLNDLATQFPADTLVVRFATDDTQPKSFRLVSIQPTAQ
jgi:hypothetical protein